MEYGRITYCSIHLDHNNQLKAFIHNHLVQFNNISYKKDY
jgi:hypothetical protein